MSPAHGLLAIGVSAEHIRMLIRWPLIRTLSKLFRTRSMRGPISLRTAPFAAQIHMLNEIVRSDLANQILLNYT